MSNSKLSGADGKVLIGSAIAINTATGNSGTVTIDTQGNHGLSAGDMVYISGVVGMTDINGYFPVASIVDTDTFTITKQTSQTYSPGTDFVQKACTITQWDIKKAIGTKEVSDSSSTGGKDYLADALYDVDGTFEGFANAGAILLSFGAVIALTLAVNTSIYWSGSAIITNIGEALQVSGGNAEKLSYTFKGTGAFTRTDNS